LLVRIC